MKNKFYKLVALSLVFGGAGLTASAQLNCGTTQATQKLYEQHPELVAAQAAYDAEIAQLIANAKSEQRSSTTVYTIPIVFHIIHQNGTENISDAQIFDQVAILNRDYRKLNADTATVVDAMKPLIADSYVEFRLAQLDPDGNCTNGIDRIYSHKTNSADDYSKLNGWPRDKYLNVWVVKTIGSVGVAGYAYYPTAVSGPLFPVDGVLILYDYIGSISPSMVSHSRALTHEIGHYLNLQHTWGNTNDPGVACGDDQVTDTPPTKGHTACTPTDRFAAVCTFNPIAANYKFDDVTTTSGTTDPTAVPVIPGVTLSSMTANGVGANSSANGEFSFDGWPTGAPDGATNYASLTGTINTSKYYEFKVTPDVTNSMSLTSLVFNINRSATGPRTWAIRASTNSFVSNIPTASVSPTNANLSVQAGNVLFLKYDSTQLQKGTKFTLGATFANVVAPITIRIYPYNAEDAFGTFGIDSVYLAGTTGLVENTENYMDYSYCSKMYTIGQKDRLRAALESSTSSRSNLWSPGNLIATGITSPAPCTPLPEFFANKVRVCEGDVVKFTKNVLYGTPDSIRWTFEGGTPATSTSLLPVNVTYNTPGIFKVTLSAINAAGRDSVVKTGYIRVDPDWADIDYNGAYTEDFENTSNFYYDWQVRNYDENPYTWSVCNFAGYNGSSQSVMMSAYNNYSHDVDDLISPSYDLSYTSGNLFTFKCAAASSAGTGAEVNDVLKLSVSKDCGNTWLVIGTYKDSTLINNGYQPTYFVPGSSSIWTTRSAVVPSAYATSNVRFKFEYTSGAAGNNIYIDYINMMGTVGITENMIADANLTIYPNPANETSTIAYHLDKKGDTKIQVVDVLGKVVYTTAVNAQPEGDYSVQISKRDQNLGNGIYFVKLSIGNESVTKKLIITE